MHSSHFMSFSVGLSCLILQFHSPLIFRLVPSFLSLSLSLSLSQHFHPPPTPCRPSPKPRERICSSALTTSFPKESPPRISSFTYAASSELPEEPGTPSNLQERPSDPSPWRHECQSPTWQSRQEPVRESSPPMRSPSTTSRAVP